MFEPTAELLILLFFTAILASFVDTLAGGGGLITIPALIMSGVPPLAALGTNKLQSSMGTGTATFMMLKHRRVHWRDVRLLMLLAFLGSAIGTVAVQFIDTDALAVVIPVVLFVIAVFFLCSPKPSSLPSEEIMSASCYRKTLVPAIGFYDGMFGPGTGSFFTMAGVAFRGQPIVLATATAKTMNFATNFASLLIFLMVGQVVWVVGLAMMLGQVVGAWLGSHCLYKINPASLRLVVVVVCLGLLTGYVFSQGWI